MLATKRPRQLLKNVTNNIWNNWTLRSYIHMHSNTLNMWNMHSDDATIFSSDSQLHG